MADILVTCPTCKTQLEIDAAYEGQEVECGSCLQVFVATTKKPKAADDEPGGRSGSGGKVRGSTSPSGRGSSRSRASRDRDRDRDDDDDRDRDRGRRRRDDDDDEDDYDHDYPSRRRDQGSNGLAITSLILGILGFVPGCFCCWVGFPMSLIATVLGGVALGKPEGKGMGIAGLILGICGMIFSFIKALFTGFAL